jgi:hypothetical protein
LSRRDLLASGATAWATVSVAGCNYITDPGPPEGGGDGGGGDDEAPTGNATVTNETTTTGDGDGSSETTSGGDCQSQQEFQSGEEVALNVGIYKSDTGDYLGADSINSVTVEFPDQPAVEPVELSWSGPHEQYIPDGWGGKLEAISQMEPGTYQYEIAIDGDDVFDEKERIADRVTII